VTRPRLHLYACLFGELTSSAKNRTMNVPDHGSAMPAGIPASIYKWTVCLIC